MIRTNGPLVNLPIFNTSNKNKAGDINSPWNLLVDFCLTLFCQVSSGCIIQFGIYFYSTGQKKLGKVITPDVWKTGARNTTGKTLKSGKVSLTKILPLYSFFFFCYCIPC